MIFLHTIKLTGEGLPFASSYFRGTHFFMVSYTVSYLRPPGVDRSGQLNLLWNVRGSNACHSADIFDRIISSTYVRRLVYTIDSKVPHSLSPCFIIPYHGAVLISGVRVRGKGQEDPVAV